MPLAARPGGVLPCCGVCAVPWLLVADDGRRLPLPADARPPPAPPPPPLRRGLLFTLGRPGVLSGLLASASRRCGHGQRHSIEPPGVLLHIQVRKFLNAPLAPQHWDSSSSQPHPQVYGKQAHTSATCKWARTRTLTRSSKT